MATLYAGPWTKVDDQIAGSHRVFVMLHHDQRVASITQPMQCGDQAIIVMGMQTDRWLVQDVQHTDQAAADLAC